MLVAQLGTTLCDPMDHSLPGSSVHGNLESWVLVWVAIPFSKGSSQSRDQTQVSCIAGRFFTIWANLVVQFSSVAQSCPTLCDSHGLHNTRLTCPSPTPGACSNSCPSSLWCHPTISSSVIPFSSYLQSFPSSGSFPVIQFFALGDQCVGPSVSASVCPVNIQDWFLLG